MSALIELHYLPCIEYIGLLLHHSSIVLEAHEYYEKQTYRNRCIVLTANKIEPLAVPVKNTGKPRSNEIQIDYSLNWQNQHWRTVASAYGNSPFFDHYEHSLQPLFYQKHETLWQHNFSLLQWILRALKSPIVLAESSEYTTDKNDSMDYRNVVHPRKTAKSLYEPIVYQQVFGEVFVPNLSVLDLLFCVGPQRAAIIAKESVKIA